jgi:hypothetical protein
VVQIESVDVQKQELTRQIANCWVEMGVVQVSLVVNVASEFWHSRVTKWTFTTWPRATACGVTAVFGSNPPAATLLQL